MANYKLSKCATDLKELDDFYNKQEIFDVVEIGCRPLVLGYCSTIIKLLNMCEDYPPPFGFQLLLDDLILCSPVWLDDLYNLIIESSDFDIALFHSTLIFLVLILELQNDVTLDHIKDRVMRKFRRK